MPRRSAPVAGVDHIRSIVHRGNRAAALGDSPASARPGADRSAAGLPTPLFLASVPCLAAAHFIKRIGRLLAARFCARAEDRDFGAGGTEHLTL